MTQLDLLAMQQSIQLEQQDEYLSDEKRQSGSTLGSTLSRLLSGGHTPSDHAGGAGESLLGIPGTEMSGVADSDRGEALGAPSLPSQRQRPPWCGGVRAAWSRLPHGMRLAVGIQLFLIPWFLAAGYVYLLLEGQKEGCSHEQWQLGQCHETSRLWRFNEAFFFAINIGLGVGYGVFQVNTWGGKVFTIVYSLISSAVCASLVSFVIRSIIADRDDARRREADTEADAATHGGDTAPTEETVRLMFASLMPQRPSKLAATISSFSLKRVHNSLWPTPRNRMHAPNNAEPAEASEVAAAAGSSASSSSRARSFSEPPVRNAYGASGATVSAAAAPDRRRVSEANRVYGEGGEQPSEEEEEAGIDRVQFDRLLEMLQMQMSEQQRQEIWESVDAHCTGLVTFPEFIEWWREQVSSSAAQHGSGGQQRQADLATAMGSIFRNFARTRQQMLRRYRRRRWRVKLVGLWLLWMSVGVLFTYNPAWLVSLLGDGPAMRNGLLYCRHPACAPLPEWDGRFDDDGSAAASSSPSTHSSADDDDDRVLIDTRDGPMAVPPDGYCDPPNGTGECPQLPQAVLPGGAGGNRSAAQAAAFHPFRCELTPDMAGDRCVWQRNRDRLLDSLL
jgi:phosphate/sulfate permease